MLDGKEMSVRAFLFSVGQGAAGVALAEVLLRDEPIFAWPFGIFWLSALSMAFLGSAWVVFVIVSAM
jgi:hypothetical protein